MAEIEYTEIEDVQDSIFLCKLFWSHSWDKNPSPKRIDGQLSKLATVTLALRCVRCGRERYDYIDRKGGLMGRYYHNPVGYPKTHRYGGDELRAEMISRSILFQGASRRMRNGKK